MNTSAQTSDEILDISVLFVEDDPHAREAFARQMKKRLKTLHIAENGLEGLESYKTYKPDIVVTDIEMPEMNGLEMSSEIYKINPDAYIFIVTAYGGFGRLKEAMDIGIDRFFQKPMDTRQVFTALKKASDSLRHQRLLKKQTRDLEDYKFAIDQATIISKADLAGNIIYVNDKFCEISGYTREELIGQSHNIVRHPSMSPSVFKELWETIQAKKIWRGRVTNRKKDGTSYIVETTIVPLLDEEGEIKEYFSLRKDVTEFVEIGRKLRKKEQEQIEQERRHLEEMNSAKDSFLMVFTHELKTPLNAVINLSQIVSQKLSAASLENKNELIDFLDIIYESGFKMHDHVVTLLDMSRLKMDRLELIDEEGDLLMHVRRMSDTFEYDIKKEHVSIDYLLPENPLIMHLDPVRIHQILSNLVSNGVKYGEGKIRISVTAREGKFYVAVEDNGKGFNEKEKVLKLFEQDGNDAYQRDSVGLGIGLHYVFLLCKKLGYDLKLSESKSLGGAKVIFSGLIEK